MKGQLTSVWLAISILFVFYTLNVYRLDKLRSTVYRLEIDALFATNPAPYYWTNSSLSWGTNVTIEIDK